MAGWAKKIGQHPHEYENREIILSDVLLGLLEDRRKLGGWNAVGYHSATLALRLGLVQDDNECLDFLEGHWSNCFPCDLSAPRNDDPTKSNQRLVTPYFAHYLMPLFIERGRMDFVLDQFRKCWGWMLEGGYTTWLEVFDQRWSHCHQWSGCPTWQLSRYLLGLHPRLDLGANRFDFRLETGSLNFAKGKIPHPAGGWMAVEWTKEDSSVTVVIRAEHDVVIALPDGKLKSIFAHRTFTVTGTNDVWV
jgi:hypothetical protein